MATLAEIYNKVASAEDYAQGTSNQRAATLLNNYNQMTSPEYGRNTDQALHAVEDAGNVLDPTLAAGSAFVNAVGSLPVIDNIAKPLAEGIDSLHSDSYEAHQAAKQAHRDVFDRNNQSRYYSDLANGKSVGMASLAKLGREAVDYFSNSNGQDLITDTASAAGSLGGSYVLGGFIGKAAKVAYSGLAAARLATTAEAKMAQYNSAIKAAESAKAQALERLGQANISNTEREALVQQVTELDNTIKTASQELNDSIKSTTLARNNLAAAETQRDLYSSTSPLKNEILRDLRLNNGTLLSDESLAKNVVYNKQKVDETTKALRANKVVLEQAQQEQSLIKDYLKADNKLNSLNKGKAKTKSLLDRANEEIEAKATKFG